MSASSRQSSASNCSETEPLGDLWHENRTADIGGIGCLWTGRPSHHPFNSIKALEEITKNA